MSIRDDTAEQWSKHISCGSKINLRLKVTGRRPDGLHELSSCFLFLEHPGDELTVTANSGGLTLECPGFPELAGSGNLVWRAAELFAGKSGISPNWHMRLVKRVPIAAGMGGGSADAGAVLSLLNGHYAAFSTEELEKLAFSLGADVPFFIRRRSAWVTGAGEIFEYPENFPAIPEILIVNPGFPVSAKWAYTHMAKELICPDDPEEKAAFYSGKANWRTFCCNDLAPALMKKFPLLEILQEQLYAAGALTVQVTGSGPTLFALFASGAAAAAKEVRRSCRDTVGIKIFTGGKEF
ncbi:MAG: 4-(cytidine 5'-diphospho)-2-C-methyl-D-erythritol kinase [Lentisphaerae bacterium]|nr:4-(cytidine 5'-diphospho)-2-C-methyl-D-erythritol kinase [Lentisphaerota bacterium]